MWYYKQTEPRLWTVGYDGAGGWTTDSDHDVREAAAQRVAFLNGQTDNSTNDVDPLDEQLVSFARYLVHIGQISQLQYDEWVDEFAAQRNAAKADKQRRARLDVELEEMGL